MHRLMRVVGLACAVCAAVTVEGDDGNYGSAATLDVLCLQALSQRIHYGKFVAEAKFR
jgi:chorismate mutase